MKVAMADAKTVDMVEAKEVVVGVVKEAGVDSGEDIISIFYEKAIFISQLYKYRRQ